MTEQRQPKPGTPHRVYAATLVLSALLGFGAVYAIAWRAHNAAEGGEVSEPAPRIRVAQATSPGGTPAQLPAGPGTNALSVGEMAAFVFKKAPEPIADFAFLDGAGKERTLKDWRGKVVLLNVWATWCLPCRKEMPGLDRLQAELGSDKFEVVAISADKTGLEGAKKFLGQVKAEKLGLYADPTVRIGSALKVIGMPATVLIDREGREIGRLVGPAEWDSTEAKALIAAAMK